MRTAEVLTNPGAAKRAKARAEVHAELEDGRAMFTLEFNDRGRRAVKLCMARLPEWLKPRREHGRRR